MFPNYILGILLFCACVMVIGLIQVRTCACVEQHYQHKILWDDAISIILNTVWFLLSYVFVCVSVHSAWLSCMDSAILSSSMTRSKCLKIRLITSSTSLKSSWRFRSCACSPAFFQLSSSSWYVNLSIYYIKIIYISYYYI